jgi:hypothetical protein
MTAPSRMSGFHARALMVLACALIAVACGPMARAEIEFDPTWQAPDYEAVRVEIVAWADATSPPDDVAAQIDALWPAEPGAERDAMGLLDRVATTVAAADSRAATLVEVCQSDFAGPVAPDAAWLGGEDVPPVVRNNLRLLLGRWLAQNRLYDEALAALDGVEPASVVDPATLLFYRMVAHHQLVEPDEARAALVQLMERKDELPLRFVQVAQLVERDLAALEDESLDHIARRMSDIRRRLAYGRAGAHVQRIEQGVIESLDRTIERLEQQMQQQMQQSQAGGVMDPTQPMEDSRLADLDAPMEVDQRDIGHSSGWGDLPPREREQALQAIGRDFPAHYRDLIEQYFRELAAESPQDAD